MLKGGVNDRMETATNRARTTARVGIWSMEKKFDTHNGNGSCSQTAMFCPQKMTSNLTESCLEAGTAYTRARFTIFFCPRCGEPYIQASKKGEK